MNKDLQLLSNISSLLSKIKYEDSLTDEITEVIKEHTNLSNLNIYIFDKSTNSLRNFSKSWLVIDEKIEDIHSKNLYNAFKDFEDYAFIFNGNGYYKYSDNILLEAKNTILFPLIKNAKIYGVMELYFEEVPKISEDFMITLQVISTELSLIIQNKILYEKMEKNVDFHDAMKNIAKIIETQYELNYIIPLIGEMIDKFIIEHLIYIFLKSEETGKYNLVWPSACMDKKILTALGRVDSEKEYFLIDNDRIGIFPLVGEDKTLGCIVARGNMEKLSVKEIEYLDQLTKQAAATINRANIYAEVLKHATLDALTGINNRHQFEIRLRQEVAASIRQNIPLCAIMIDIDFFKSVNDTYGHQAGDTVLKEVSNTIKNSLRESDIPSRYGGEEFAILLPFTKLEEAYSVAQRLRASVEQAEINISDICEDKDFIKVTISVGVSEFNKDITGEELFRRADKALYDAKTHGRNKVVIFENEQ